MSSSRAAIAAKNDFETFLEEIPPEKLDQIFAKSPCLADLIAAWLRSDCGVRACHGDFETYLVAIIGIIDSWLRDPAILGHVVEQDEQGNQGAVLRRVSSIFGDEGFRHRTLDRYFFASQVFDSLHRRPQDGAETL